MARSRKQSAAAGGAFVAREPGLPVVVLVGRANAGKSTLFNRIARGGRAIVSPIAGTTRDINFGRAVHGGAEFLIADSGGLELGGRTALSERIAAEALRAIALADVVVLMFDGRAGLSAADQEAFALVRETGRPMIVAINKIDHDSVEPAAGEFYALGAERLFMLSAAHGRGVGGLLDEIAARLPAAGPAGAAQPDLKVALIGRPNVGKSSLLNRLAGAERALVDDHPGTTRDPVDIRLTAEGQDLLLIDTAGIRRPARVEGGLEHHSVGRAIETIRRADVLVLVTDALEGVTDQDARLARLVEANGRALVIVCNKWDLAARAGRRIAAFAETLHRRYPFLDFATVVFASALSGDGVGKIIPAALAAGACWRAQFKTAQLNRILAESAAAMDPPLVARRRLNLMYVTQVAAAPPRLRFFANLERGIPAHYLRFLEGCFRRELKLIGTPLRLEFTRTGRTFASRSRAAGPYGGHPAGTRPRAE